MIFILKKHARRFNQIFTPKLIFNKYNYFIRNLTIMALGKVYSVYSISQNI